MRGILLDTSILAEYFKGNPDAKYIVIDLFDSDRVLFLNPIIFSEVTYLLLGFYSGRAPRTLKGRPEKLPEEIKLVFKTLESYAFVDITFPIAKTARKLIEKHAMLPNDALILATCIEHDFSLAILDEDFLLPAKEAGVEIIGVKQ